MTHSVHGLDPSRLARRWRQVVYQYFLPVLQIATPLPIAVSLVCCAVLLFSGQMEEVLRGLTEAEADSAHLIFGIASFLGLATLMFAYYITNTSTWLTVVHGSLPRMYLPHWLRWTRRFLAVSSTAAPLATLAYVLSRIAPPSSPSGSVGLAIALTALAMAVPAIGFWFLRRTWWLERYTPYAIVAICVLQMLVVPFLGISFLVDTSRRLGPLAMTGLQFIAAFAILAFVSLLLRQHRTLVRHVVSIWLTFAVIAGFVRLVLYVVLLFRPNELPASSKLREAEGSPTRQVVSAALATWLKQQSAGFKGDTYPVYIVAAEGGGIYAASAVAAFLADMPDKCPDFSRQLFAVTGVSGGAVGAAVYSLKKSAEVKSGCSLQRYAAAPPGNKDGASRAVTSLEAVTATLQRDHLSPVLAVMVSDLVVSIGFDLWHFVSYPLRMFSSLSRQTPSIESVKAGAARSSDSKLGSDDGILGFVSSRFARRACMLEASLARDIPNAIIPKSCSDAPGGDVSDSLSAQWGGGSEAALVLTTTRAETGEAVSFAPFAFDAPLKLKSFAEPGYGIMPEQISVLKAAVASARFPLVMPPYVVSKDGKAMNFVDGGYVDNSGVAVAGRMYKGLNGTKVTSGNREVKADVRLILLTSDDGRGSCAETPGSKAFVDLLVPIQAMLNVRASIGPHKVAELLDDVTLQEKITKIDFGSRFFLGWTMSKTTYNELRLDVTPSPSATAPGKDDASTTQTLQCDAVAQPADVIAARERETRVNNAKSFREIEESVRHTTAALKSTATGGRMDTPVHGN